jgi:hypothetical protein
MNINKSFIHYPEVGLTFLRDTNFLTNGKTYCTSPADDRHIITILLGLLKFLILGKYYQHDTWLLMPYFFWETDNVGVRVMVFNATSNNISVISWWPSVLLVEGTRVPGENHRPVASH